MTSKKKEGSFATFRYENDILFITMREGILLDQPEMEELLKEAVEFTGGEKYFAIVDTRPPYFSTSEASKYYSSSEYMKFRYADAFIVNSLAMRMLVNFYIRFQKPVIPTQMFTDEKKALDWILEQKKKVKGN